MKITANHIYELGVADGIIPEPRGGAHRDLKQQAANIKAALETHLEQLLKMSEEQLLEDRYNKYRTIGKFTFIQQLGEVQ